MSKIAIAQKVTWLNLISLRKVDFCADYLGGVHSVGLPYKTRPHLKDANAPLGSGSVQTVDPSLRHRAHLCVLDNTPELQPYIVCF